MSQTQLADGPLLADELRACKKTANWESARMWSHLSWSRLSGEGLRDQASFEIVMKLHTWYEHLWEDAGRGHAYLFVGSNEFILTPYLIERAKELLSEEGFTVEDVVAEYKRVGTNDLLKSDHYLLVRW